MKKLSIRDCDVKGKRVLARVDFNVPLDSDQSITDDTRIAESLPTIRDVVDRGGRLVLMSHLGRPRGQREPGLSLEPVAHRLAELVKNPLRFSEDCVGDDVKKKVDGLKDGEILLLENLRFHAGEEENDPAFAKQLAERGVEIDEGALYPMLRRLETQGLLTSEWREDAKRQKRFYRLSADGAAALEHLASEWRAMNRALDSILGVSS
jgi:DNA-binding MarR family transcriptional regulator